MSGPHGTSCSSPSGADMPRSSADPSLRERSGLSLHAIRRARWGAPETGACAQPARSLPRSRRGRETQLLHHHPGANAGCRAEPLPCPASAPRRSHPPRPHTRWTHLSPLGNQTDAQRTRPGLLTLGATSDQALLPDPRQQVKAIRAPWLKYPELHRPKAQAEEAILRGAGTPWFLRRVPTAVGPPVHPEIGQQSRNQVSPIN